MILGAPGYLAAGVVGQFLQTGDAGSPANGGSA
jgi:hypothetical protein